MMSLSEMNYVSMKTKAVDVQEAMGGNSCNILTTNTTDIGLRYNRGQKSIEERKVARRSFDFCKFLELFI
jgi:hypothetical protein